MTLEEALEWEDRNSQVEAVERLRSRAACKALADEVRSIQGADEACKEVEQALEGLPYKGTYAQQIQQMRLDMVTLQALVGGSDDISQSLIDERETLAVQNQQMREALDRWKEANLEGEISTLNHAYKLRKEALALPDLATDILRKRDVHTIADFLEKSGTWMMNDVMLAKRDAETLRNAASIFEILGGASTSQLRMMADKLEAGK